MIKKMHSSLVATLVAMLTFSPATACHYCGGYGGGGYYYGGGYGGYYTGCYSGGYGYSGGCCGGEVVVSDGCGGCSDCGSCDGCGCEGETTSSAEMQPQMMAPEAPAHEPTSRPSTVNRVPTEPAPALPTYQAPVPTTEPATPLTPPAEDRYTTPAVTPEPMTPPATEPATEEPVAEPSTEPQDDLFGPPSTEETPLPAEEPATPAEADDFFSTPATEPATDTAPPTPAEEPAAAPLDDELFGPPAEEEPKEDEPAEESTSVDDLFGNAEAILGLPGGLSSSENRHWVDNTGNFTCDGRMLRMLDGKVQILKATGRTTTVPLTRLSNPDLKFVNRQANAQKVETLSKTAQASNAR